MDNRKRITGYDQDGLPRWLKHYLKFYSHLDNARARVDRRLIRMLNVSHAYSDRAFGHMAGGAVRIAILQYSLREAKAEIKKLKTGADDVTRKLP